MTVPQRKPAPVEATQELQALDVVEIESLTPEAADAPAARRSTPSNSSIAPVGLDLARARGRTDEEANPTMQIRLPTRRQRLRGIVIGAVAGCLVILLAAGIARIANGGHAPESSAMAAQPSPAAAPATTTAASPSPATPSPGSTPAETAPAAATAAGKGGSGDVPSTGTVRLARPAVPGRVWLDGKKLTSSSALVSCGTHQVKVGFKRAHSIDVPCGGEIAVSK